LHVLLQYKKRKKQEKIQKIAKKTEFSRPRPKNSPFENHDLIFVIQYSAVLLLTIYANRGTLILPPARRCADYFTSLSGYLLIKHSEVSGSTVRPAGIEKKAVFGDLTCNFA